AADFTGDRFCNGQALHLAIGIGVQDIGVIVERGVSFIFHGASGNRLAVALRTKGVDHNVRILGAGGSHGAVDLANISVDLDQRNIVVVVHISLGQNTVAGTDLGAVDLEQNQRGVLLIHAILVDGGNGALAQTQVGINVAQLHICGIGSVCL